MSHLTRIARKETQGLVEYGTHPALIAVLAITAPLFLSGRLDTILSTIGARL